MASPFPIDRRQSEANAVNDVNQIQSPKSQDGSQRFLFEDADIRGELVRLGESYLQTVATHAYPPAVQRLLGEFLAATVLLASTIKYEGRLVLQARGDGELSLVMAECSSEGEIRGIARYGQLPTADDFTALMGAGTLAITIDSRQGEPYQGVVSLQGDSLADCLAQYFAQSEQLATEFFIAADDRQVAALLLQQLPAGIEKDIDQRAEQWRRVQMLAQTLKEEEMLAVGNQRLLHRLYHQESLRLFEPRLIRYQCSCSRERTAGALLSVGREQVEEILAEQGSVDMTCEFCGSEYKFSEAELALLFNERGSGLTH
jgi:molecular chaperone Hsp33